MPIYTRWQGKPWPGVGVDPTHPLSAGLVMGWTLNEGTGGANSAVTDVYGVSGTMAATYAPTWVASSVGTCLMGQVYGINGAKPAILPSTDCTIACLCSIVSVTSYGVPFGVGTADPTSVQLQMSPTGAIRFVVNNSVLVLSGASYTGTGLHMVMGTVNGSGANLYIDGVSVGTGSGAAPNFGASPISYIAYNAPDTDYAWTGLIAGCWLWNRVLLAAEATSFAANPWQIHQPQAGWLFNPAAGGPSFHPWYLGDQVGEMYG